VHRLAVTVSVEFGPFRYSLPELPAYASSTTVAPSPPSPSSPGRKVRT
jgi:hypothetical protein